MSSKVSDRLNRMLLMVPFLAREEGASVEELCGKFEIDRATLMQDLDTLQMCGIPDYSPADLMEWSLEGGRVRMIFADYFKRPLNLTRQEALSLFVAGSALIRSGVFTESGALESALGKIEQLLSDESKEKLDEVIARIEVEMRAYEGTMREIIDQGLEQGMNLELDYWSFSRDEMTRREVEPVSLVCSRGFWYLVAWCHVSEDFRLFRLDRIAAVTLTEHPASKRIRESFDVPRVVGEYKPGKKAHQVKLTFAGRQGRRIVEEWPTAHVSERGDGSVHVELRTRNLEWLATYLLRFGDNVRVEGPRELKNMVERNAKSLLEAYS
ncbi:MAG: helix-turn-helix transcriptional regulator [Candidatus Geothermincolia bacterium]